jgi:hypothetical protein
MRNVVVEFQANLTARRLAVVGNNPDRFAVTSQTDFDHFAPMLEQVDFELSGKSLAAVADFSMSVRRVVSMQYDGAPSQVGNTG